MPSAPVLPHLLPIALLIGSNVFMTLAWYGHLRFKEVPLVGVMLVSWLIAFVEYCMAVPANRWGSAVYTTAQLKTMQEVVTLLVFVGFSIFYLREPITSNYAIGFRWSQPARSSSSAVPCDRARPFICRSQNMVLHRRHFCPVAEPASDLTPTVIINPSNSSSCGHDRARRLAAILTRRPPTIP
jgi:uncharacterized protein (DUF486 family)